MYLQDFWDYKNQLMKDLLMNDEICELIDETITPEQARDPDIGLAYTHVFPYEYIPLTIEDGHTYLCFDADIQSVDYKTFYTPVLYIWTFTHRSRLRLNDGQGIRPDKLCSKICEVIDGSRYYGLGEMKLYSVKRFAPMTDYIGKQMTFTMREFHSVYDGKKSTPANRKKP